VVAALSRVGAKAIVTGSRIGANAAPTILALWRAPEQLAGAVAWRGDAALIDVASFGEIGLLPARRGPDGRPVPISHGAVAPPRGTANAA
jgi:hypothetical protein